MDKMPAPQISVLMTFFNPGPFIKPAIESVLNQTFEDFEIILVNDGSTDESPFIVSQFTDSRIRYIEQNLRIGRTPALICALGEAKGKYIAVLDADDLCEKERFAVQTNYLNSHPDIVLVGSNCRHIDSFNNVIGKFEPLDEQENEHDALCYKNVIAHSSAMYRRQAAIQVGGYPEIYSYAQDYGLWSRLHQIGDVILIPEHLTLLREHPDRMSIKTEYLLARNFDVIRILRDLGQSPNLSKKTRVKNRQALAHEYAKYSLNLMRLGHLFSSIKWAALAIVTSPKKTFQNLAHVFSKSLKIQIKR